MWKKCFICVCILANLGIATEAFAQYYTDDYYKRSRKDTRYDYIYQAPRRQSLGAQGRYIFSNSTVRYIGTRSKLKNAAHAARIQAYNEMYGNY